ncbi:unnamed protein product [Protopolystoma xenopodis]|uniref:Uncharacterized protein n=1 Tax=Protopolystoma xenopodis TaxID=117903 RepID=A0A3S5AGF0_9PLAT|nr:unnamed protein product [Protopolystoma xenopodis]
MAAQIQTAPFSSALQEAYFVAVTTPSSEVHEPTEGPPAGLGGRYTPAARAHPGELMVKRRSGALVEKHRVQW